MNPSYNSGSGNSGASNTPGVKPGVIASGPDPADVPAPQPLSVSTTPKVMPRKSLFGRRPNPAPAAPRISQPMQLNTATNKPKKGLVIGGLVVIVLLIVGLLAGMMMGGGKSGGGSTDGNFNRLINYVTSGTDSTAKVDKEYSALGDYYFLNGWDSQEEKAAVYAKTKELLDAFVAKYQDGENEVLNNLVKSTKEQFDFMDVVDLKEEISWSDVITTGVKKGEKEIEKNMLDYYGFSIPSDNS